LIFGQLAKVFDHRQVAVVPSYRTRPILPLPLLGRRGRGLIVLAFETIRPILGRSGLGLSTEELIPEFAILTTKLLEIGFEPLGPLDRPSMLSLPIPDLLPQFGVLASETVDLKAQSAHFTTELPDQFGQLDRLGGRKRIGKRAFHNDNACTQSRSSDL
jgi:hypothetical protein